jgi:hypothetical protein
LASHIHAAGTGTRTRAIERFELETCESEVREDQKLVGSVDADR